MSYWSDRPARAHLKYEMNGAPVYQIGRYEVTITVDKPPADAVTYREDRSLGRPRAAFANMEIVDGVMKIPVSDFIDEIMARSTPLELATGLFEDEDVRKHMIEALAQRWSQDGFTDADRRKFLHDVQEAVHSGAVDALAGRIADMEWHNSQRFYARQLTADVNQRLRDNGIDRQIPYEPEDPVFKIGGKAWQEARDDWRALVLASFPAPIAPAEAPAEDGVL